MKRLGVLLAKIAAVFSSLLLAGGYVAFQAGVLPLPGARSKPTRVMVSSKFGRVSLPMSALTTQPAEPKREVLMFSSKSGPVVTPSNEPTVLMDPAPISGRILMSGSKSGILIPPTAEQPALLGTGSVLISSSKSTIVLTPEQLKRFTISTATTMPTVVQISAATQP